MLIFGIMDLGRVVWALDNLANSAREGAHYAAIHGDSKFATCPTGPNLAGAPGTGCPAWTPDSKEPTRAATRGFLVAPGAGVSVTVCYYATTPCSGDVDEVGVKNQRGAYVTVRITSTVPLVTGSFLGLGNFSVSGSSTVLINN